MAREVKRGPDGARRLRTTRVSAKNQVTIPVAELRESGLSPGDVVRVHARGPGELVLTRIDELIDRYAGGLETEGRMRRQVEELREEWR